MAGQEREGEYVVLTDENGESHEFEVVDVINVEGKDYAILAEPGDEDHAFALRLENDEAGNDVLVDIEDEEEWERVVKAWEEIQDDDEWDGDADEEDDEDWDSEAEEEDEDDADGDDRPRRG